MKKWIIIGSLFFFGSVTAQNRKVIDSVNAIPFAAKAGKAHHYATVFLKNAEDAKKAGYTDGEAESYANAALTYYFQGKYDKDVAFMLRAISLFQKSGNKERLAYYYGELGYRMKRRDMAKAQAYMVKGKRIAESNKFVTPLLSIYNNYGVLKEMQQQLDSALYFYNKSLKTQQSVGDSIGIPFSLNNIAGLYLIRKEYDKAKPIFERVLGIRKKRNDKTAMAETYTSLAELAAAQGQHAESVALYQKGLTLASEAGYLHLVSNNYKMMSQEYEALGNGTRAFETYKLHTRFKDSILNTETNERVAELEVEFETGEKEKQLAIQKAEVLEKDLEVRKSRSTIIVISILTLFVGICGFLFWRQQRMANRQQRQEFSLKAAIAQIESQNKLQEQRLAISRDLHDNIGAQLTFIISSVDSLRYGFKMSNPSIVQKLGNITDFTRSTIVELRDTIWAMNHSDITFDDLKTRILNFVEKAQTAAEDVRFSFSIASELEPVVLTSVAGMNLYRVIQEAVNNAMKYANPTAIVIEASVSGNEVTMSVRDNGKGFDTAETESGNGLVNMVKRMEDIGGSCTFSSTPGEGTQVTLSIRKEKLNS